MALVAPRSISAKTALAGALCVSRATDLALEARRRQPLILRYHRVHPDGWNSAYELGIARSVFEAQLDFLTRTCTVVSLADLCAGLTSRRPLPDRAVSLTFDDGYRDNYSEAFPALRARGLPATVFVTAGHLDSGAPFWWDRLAGAVCSAPAREYTLDLGRGPEPVRLDGDLSRRRLIDHASARAKMIPHREARTWLASLCETLGDEVPGDRSVLSWQEAREMAAGGIEIGSHTLDHPILSRLDPAEAERQVVVSRRVIEERIGRTVRFFAYPNGTPEDFTPAVEGAVRAAGYEAALTTIDGRPRISSDLFKLERVAVSNGMTTDSRGFFSESLFAAEISGLMNALLLRRGSRGAH